MEGIPEEARPALDTIREVGGDDLVVALLRTFLEYVDAQLKEATTAAAAGDVATVARVAHAIKSSANQVGAHSFADICLAAERAGGGADAAAAVAFVTGMTREFDLVRTWMEPISALG
jgi:HPt (histidine-containing phosphotransfer) domain-containing protein